MPDDEQRRLEKTIDALQIRFGPRAVRQLGEGGRAATARLATGFPALDGALGGGLPRGRIVEIAGAPTAGMATLSLKVVAQAQAQGETGVYLDLEQTFDPDYAARCGVALDRLLLVRPRDAGQAFALLRDFAGGESGVLVCDLPPAVAADARLAPSLSSTLGRLLSPLARSSTVLICLVSLPAGRASADAKLPVRHYATVRLLLQRERWLYRGEDIRGYRAHVVIAKNKLGPAGETGDRSHLRQTVTIDVTFNGVVQGDGAPADGGT